MAQPARWAHLAANDEQTLLEVAEVPGDVGDATLNALTHLPLRTEAWDRVRFLLRERLASTGESERQHFLRGVQRWIPDLDSGSAIVDKQELHGQEGPARTVRRDPDIAWIQSRAPGFLFIDADARAAAVAAVSPDLQAVVVGQHAGGTSREEHCLCSRPSRAVRAVSHDIDAICQAHPSRLRPLAAGWPR